LVLNGAGSWVSAKIYLVPAGASPADVNLTCSPLVVLSTTTLSCALPFLLPEVATASSVLTQVWVAHDGTGGVPQPLNVTVKLMPPPSIAIVTGGGLGLASQTPGTGRVVLRLPASRLTAADWVNGGLSPPPTAVIDSLAVWLDGVPCTEPVWETNTTISCATPATDATDVAAVVQLAGGMFNVSGELASLLSTPALSASTSLQLLPPAAATNRTMNVTLIGVALCTGGVSKVASASVAGVPCASVACIRGRSDAVLCVGWNATHPTLGALRNTLHPAANVTVHWVSTASRPVTCTACVVLASRPVLSSISPTSIAAPGAEVVITGTGMMDASQVPPVVLIGGKACRNVTVVASSAVIRCVTPTLPPTAPGFPVVSVMVINTAGAASTEAVTITYPATFAVSWASSPNGTSALPGSVLTPAPTLRVLTREAATCTVAMSTPSCGTIIALAASRPAGMTVSMPTSALAVGASGSSYAATTNLLLDALAVTGASGCTGILVAACSNGAGQAASTAGLFNLTVALLEWRADWNASSVPHPFIVVPDVLPTVTAVFELANTPGNYFAPASLVDSLSCYALLMPASATPPLLSQLLDRLSSKDVLSSSTATLVAVTSGSGPAATVAFGNMSASGVQLGRDLALYAECTWAPTSERVRLPSVPLSTLRLALDWVQPPSTVLGYAAQPLQLAVTTVTSATGATPIATAECQLVLINATAASARLGAADPWTLDVNGTAPAGMTVATTANVTIEAPPTTTLFIRASCIVWGQALTSPPLRLTTATLAIQQVSSPPTSFIASDASSAWTIEPQLVVVVSVADASGTSASNATDASCSLSTATPGAELKVTDSSTSLLSMAADSTTGAVVVPHFYVQTATTTPSVELVLECRRTSDAPPLLRLTIPAIRLTAELCTQPARDSLVGTALRPFNVSIVATPPSGPPTTPCTEAPNSGPPPPALPVIACTIALNASTTSIADTSGIVLQHTIAMMSATTHAATFDAFTLVAQQGETYGLSLTCAVGGLAILPSLSFSVMLAGCSVGQESKDVSCVPCGGTTFSPGGMGARCKACPPAGATCSGGIITLLPHYFRPPVQAGVPLGPDTELHPCYNAEACVLTYGDNVTTAAYGCAYGYTGPLCGVCDADVNYARFGEACAVCWSAGASWTLLLLVLAVVLAMLTRVALRKSTSRSDSSIVLRIALGYVQAVGSLRVFRAGSTKAYDSVMGWTEVVSANPLSAGALQCILRLPFLVQYLAVVLLPVFAAAAVVAIFHAAAAGRSVHCKPRFGLDLVELKTAVSAWWASKRHLSTLLFVLFLTYMPIVSASLRALDCLDPVAGVRYLRSDLRVQCSVGEHAAARALAYTVLIVLGIGFPVALAWLLGTASNGQLADAGFHATWGFLFDGYRTPTSPPALTAAGGTKGSGAGIVKLSTSGAQGPPAAASKLMIVGTGTAQAEVVDSRVWWEAVVLCRKAGVVLLAVLVTNPYLQCVGAALWFFAAYVLQMRYSPYANPLFNQLETASLASTLLTAIISTALLQYNAGVTSSADLHPPDAMTGIEWAVTVLLAVINVGMLAALAGLWLRLQCARVRGMLTLRRATVLAGPPLPPPRLPQPVPRKTHHDTGGTTASTVNPLRVRSALVESPVTSSSCRLARCRSRSGRRCCVP